MMVLDEKVVGLWYVEIAPKVNWMAVIRELEPDQEYELVYRFRYYKDDKAFDSEDLRSWYRGVLTGTRHYVVESFRSAARLIESNAIGKLFEVMNEGDYKDFMRRFQNQPFAWVRQVSNEEAERIMKERMTGEERG